MRWIRSHVRLGAWCALFALAVQLVLSFGHVHLNGGSSTSVPSALSTRLMAPAPSAASEAPALPADQDSDGQAGRFCDICALIQLAGSVTPAAAPVLASPATFDACSPIAIFLPGSRTSPGLTSTVVAVGMAPRSSGQCRYCTCDQGDSNVSPFSPPAAFEQFRTRVPIRIG
jgi:hypothetical protein